MAGRDGDATEDDGPKDTDARPEGAGEAAPPDLSPGAGETPDPAPGAERADPGPDEEPVIPASRPEPSATPDPAARSGEAGAAGGDAVRADLAGSVAPAALGIGLPPPVGGMPFGGRDDEPGTDAADPLMPPASTSPAAGRPSMGFEASADPFPDDARDPAPDGSDDPKADGPREDGPKVSPMPSVGRSAPEPVEPATSSGPTAPPDPELAPQPGREPAVTPRTSSPPSDPRPAQSVATQVDRRGGGGSLGTFLLSVLAAGAVAYGVLWWFDREGAGTRPRRSTSCASRPRSPWRRSRRGSPNG